MASSTAIAARMPRREQAADEADRGLEHRKLAVDVEIEMGLHPFEPLGELGVELHQPERVERLDQGEAEMVVPEREAPTPPLIGLISSLPNARSRYWPQAQRISARTSSPKRAPVLGAALRAGRSGQERQGGGAGEEGASADRGARQSCAGS